jgi:hypothetical protein
VLSGTFEFFALADVLGLIERSEASGALVVRGREVEGSLYFIRGMLTAGEIGEVSGPVESRPALEVRLLEVMVPLLRARTAKFDFEVDAVPSWPTTADVPISAVFEPARDIARDWASIMKTIGSFETPLARTGGIVTSSITLSHLGFRVLELVDGERSIREVARRAGVSLVAVAPEVRNLLEAGAVRVVEDQAGSTTRVDLVLDGATPAAVPAVTGAPNGSRAPAAASPLGAATAPPVPPEPEPEAAPAPVENAPEPEAVPEPVASEPVPEPEPERVPDPIPEPVLDPMPDPVPDPVPEAPPAPAPTPRPAPETEPELAPVGAPGPERAEIVVDRSELLRMFSGLKDE